MVRQRQRVITRRGGDDPPNLGFDRKPEHGVARPALLKRPGALEILQLAEDLRLKLFGKRERLSAGSLQHPRINPAPGGDYLLKGYAHGGIDYRLDVSR